MRSWLAALRIARREARRAKGRSALVASMIGVPVLGLAFLAIGYDSFELKPAERAQRTMGSAQAMVIWPQDGPLQQFPTDLSWSSMLAAEATPEQRDTDRLLSLLPAGSRTIRNQTGAVRVGTAAGLGNLRVRQVDLADPLARGLFTPLAGRTPSTSDEVVLTRKASQRLAAGVGGTVHLADGSRTFRVVGIVEEPDRLDDATIVVRSDALDPDELPGGQWTERGWLVDTPGPLTWNQVKQLNTHGVVALSRHVLAHPPSENERYREGGDGGEAAAALTLIGGLALLEIVLLAGSAFAVGARRRRRDLALVAAAGGKPAHLRRIVLADGVVLGVLAAAGSIALAIAAFAVMRPMLEGWGHTRIGAFRIFPEALAGLAALAVLTGVLAAVVPAFIASRQDVVAALAGRRGITRSRRRWAVLGLALVLTGVGVAATGALRARTSVIIAGLVAAELGMVICTPAAVGLVARLGHWLPLTPRIALRDTSRNRTAAAPAISAVMAAVAGTLTAGMIMLASSERDVSDHRALGRAGDVTVIDVTGGKSFTPPQREGAPLDKITNALRRNMPIAQVYELRQAQCATHDVCMVAVSPAAAYECPFSFEVLRREPTPAEQRAARRMPRCADAGREYRYYGGLRSTLSPVYVVDEGSAGTVANVSAEDADRAAGALRSGAVVVSDERYLDNGRVTLTLTTFPPSAIEQLPNGTRLDRSKAQTRTVSAPGFLLPHGAPAPVTMLTRATAGLLGLAIGPAQVLATASRTPSQEEIDRAQSELSVLGEVYVQVDPGSQPPLDPWGLRVLAIVSGVVTLGAAAVATGLAAADRRPDLSTLAAVGASPRVRRLLSLSQSGVIAGLGSVFGGVVGLGAALAVLVARNEQVANVWPAPTPYPLAVPWLNVGITLLLVPAIAMIGAGLLTRSRLPIERRL